MITDPYDLSEATRLLREMQTDPDALAKKTLAALMLLKQHHPERFRAILFAIEQDKLDH